MRRAGALHRDCWAWMLEKLRARTSKNKSVRRKLTATSLLTHRESSFCDMLTFVPPLRRLAARAIKFPRFE